MTAKSQVHPAVVTVVPVVSSTFPGAAALPAGTVTLCTGPSCPPAGCSRYSSRRLASEKPLSVSSATRTTA
ncbi:MAG: hypothetical protein V9E87_03110 [Gemmatimonadales bacterium]